MNEIGHWCHVELKKTFKSQNFSIEDVENKNLVSDTTNTVTRTWPLFVTVVFVKLLIFFQKPLCE
jgi:hypothetical protein